MLGYDTDCISINGVDCEHAPLVLRPVMGTYCCASNVEIPSWRTASLLGYDTDVDLDSGLPTSKPVYNSAVFDCVFPVGTQARYGTRLLGYDTDTLYGESTRRSRPVYGAGTNSCTVVCGNTNCVLPLVLTATIRSIRGSFTGNPCGEPPPGSPPLLPNKCKGDVSGFPAVVTLIFNPVDHRWEGVLPNACGGCSPGGTDIGGPVSKCLLFQTDPNCGACFCCFGFGADPTDGHCDDCSPPLPGNACFQTPTLCSCDPIHFHYHIPQGCGSGPCGFCIWDVDITV